MHIVIMAGGGGTRLWPVSRESFPKQFARLVGRRTLLQLTYERARAVAGDRRNILVTTRRAYATEVRRQLPRLPSAHLLVEPERRDTAPSIALAATYLAAQGKHDEPLVMMPSDHLIQEEALFRMALRALNAVLREPPERTVLLGAEPTYPETGLGYIERGIRIGRMSGMPMYNVRRFAEKPNLAVAKRYLNSGRYLWNMGVYGWRVNTLLQLFHTHQPAMARQLDKLQQLWVLRAPHAQIDRLFRRLPAVSVDYALTERQNPASIVVLPGAYGWSDVGHWASMAEVLGGRTAMEIRRGKVTSVKSTGNFVYHDSSAALGLVGVHDLIVVTTPDALLICNKRNTQDVKALVAELKRSRQHKFL